MNDESQHPNHDASRTVLETALIEAVLQEAAPRAEQQREERVTKALAAIRGRDTAEPAESQVILKPHRWRIWTGGFAAAAAIVLAVLLILPNPQPALAAVTLQRAVSAAREAVVRQYRVLIERSGALLGPPTLQGELLYRGGGDEPGRFRAEFDGVLRGGITLGYDGAQFWFKGPLGGVQTAPTPKPLERILGSEAEQPFMQLDTVLSRLSGSYDILAERLPEQIKLIAKRKPETLLGPDQIDLLINPNSGVVERLEATWERSIGPGPTRVVLELLNAAVEDVDPNVFAPSE